MIQKRTCRRFPSATMLLLLVTLLPVPLALLAAEDGSAGVTPRAFTLTADIPYRDGPSPYERERCRLDLYIPDGRTGFPVLVWFHGGGLKAGEKSDDSVTVVGQRLAAEGIGVALPSYRLSPQVKFPAYVEDAARSVAWVYHHIQRWGGNPDRLFVGGHSAGAYLTVMIGLDPRFLKAAGLPPGRIKGLIPVSGQMYSHSTVREERGPAVGVKSIDDSAPLYYVRQDAPALLDICADSDTILGDNRLFVEKMRAAGHPDCQLVVIAGRTHMSIVTEMANRDDAAAGAILQFMARLCEGRLH